MRRGIAVAVAVVPIALGIAWRSGAIRLPLRADAELDPPRHAVRHAERLNPRAVALEARSASDHRVDRFAAVLARIHAELEFWETRVTAGIENKEPNAALGLRLHELEGLLTDENCAAIVCELSTTELQSPFGIAALRRWLALDPIAASRAVAMRADATDDLAFLVADSLIERPADLLALWQQSPNSGWIQKVLRHAAGAALTIDPRAAVDLAQHVSDSEVRAALLPQIVNHWVQREPGAAMEWIANVPDRSLRESLVSAAAISFATVDPTRAAEWLIQGLTDREALKGALKELVGVWGAGDIDAAEKWANALSDPELRSTALKTVANRRTQLTGDPG